MKTLGSQMYKYGSGKPVDVRKVMQG